MSLTSVLALASTVLAVAAMAPSAAAGDTRDSGEPGPSALAAAPDGGSAASPSGLKTYIRITNYQTIGVTCTAYRESDNAAVASGTLRARQSSEQKVSGVSSFDPPAGNPDLYMKCTGGGKEVTIRKSQNKLKLNVNQQIVVECNGHGTSLQCRADTAAIERA